MLARRENLDVSPHKRLLRTIIADYDLPKALCELVDNAFDTWHLSGSQRPLRVELTLRNRVPYPPESIS